MNAPFLWNCLRFLAALYALCLLVAVGDLTMGLASYEWSWSLSAGIAGSFHLATLWWLVTFVFAIFTLPVVGLFWRAADSSTEDAEASESEEQEARGEESATARDEQDAPSAQSAQKDRQRDEYHEAMLRWEQTLEKFARWTLGPPAAHHWGFLVAVCVAALTAALAFKPAVEYSTRTLFLADTVGHVIVCSASWFAGYLAYRLITKIRPTSASYPALIMATAGGVTWLTCYLLDKLDPKYIVAHPGALGIVMVTCGLLLSRHLSFKASGVVIGFACVASLVSFSAYDIDDESHNIVMQRSLFGQHVLKYSTIFLDPDADDIPSSLPNADCGPMDEFQNFEAIEIIGDGKDNNCLAGDITLEEIAPMRPADSDLLPIERQTETPLPPIIIITVDTLRADYIGKKIKNKTLTPQLDALFADSSYFTHAYAPSTHTMDSMPSTFSGMYPGSALLNGVFLGNDRSLAEIAQGLGYRTEAVTTIPGMHHTISLGFDSVDNTLGARDRHSHTGPEVTELGVARLRRLHEGDSPFLLWLHYFEPHGFYIYLDVITPWLDDIEDTVLRAYAQEVTRVDAMIGLFLRELNKLGLYDKSVIIFFSDHGEGLGEDGVEDHVWNAAESILRVPFAIKLPGLEPRRIDTPVSLVDLVPTMIEALSIKNTEPRPGRSLLSVMKGGALALEPIFISATYQYRPILWAVIQYPWKLVFDRRTFNFSLQNIEKDPNAIGNISGQNPEKFRELKQIMGKWRDRHFHNLFIEQKSHRLKKRNAQIPPDYKGEINFPHQLPVDFGKPDAQP